MSNERILVVDDEKLIRFTLRESLAEENYVVHEAASVAEATDAFERHRIDCAIVDHKLPDGDGFDLMVRFKDLAPEVPVIMMTAYSTIEKAVEAMRRGAFTYVNKPFDADEMVVNVRSALETTRLRREVHALRRLQEEEGVGAIIGESPQMREIIALINKVAPTNSTVLITGESGVGKEIVARTIHHRSTFSGKLFLPVNCGAIPEKLLESQLFGHIRGSFTGAVNSQEGLFQRARGGTIFLDEISDFTTDLQVKLLRAIEEKEILSVGSATPVLVDVRIIAATNRDLRRAVEEGRFREDLYYRLNVIGIEIPPLRERRDDIPPLVEYLVRRHNRDLNRNYKGVDNATMKLLMGLPWKGNVRELDNIIEHAMILGDGALFRSRGQNL